MYIKRNPQGGISAVSLLAEGDITEWMADDAVELLAFVAAMKAPTQMSLEQSDQAMARVLEDLVNVLVDKGTIRFTDLPEAAQQKLLSRRELRDTRNAVYLLDEDEGFNL